MDSWCSKYVISKSNLIEWKQNVLTPVGDTILELSRQSRYNTFSIRTNISPNNNLKNLQAKYAITLTEKVIKKIVKSCTGFQK